MIVYKISKVGNTSSIFADNQIHKIYTKYVDELKNETLTEIHSLTVF